MNKLYRLIIAAIFILPSSVIIAAGNPSTDELKTVVDKSSKINLSAAQSQKKIDKISVQIQDKVQQFRIINKETEGLTIFNLQMERQIESQMLEMQRLANSMDQVTVIERQITPLMTRMIAGLEEFIRLDVPFLPQERSKRIVNLHEMMDRADVTVSEKFRRVLEAFQVEMDYGRTIESYAGNADIDGKNQDVNYLRIGRVALVYQSRDKQKMGIWDQKQRKWSQLDGDYRTQVSKGLRMAQKQLAPDMILVPVAAAQAK